jgi:predicted Rossmann fold nucleotide-binding protein DprA/Smf involved in DNA uptake
MGAALQSEGVAVGVPAESLMRMTKDAEVRRAVTNGRLCLCTPFKPTASFSVANAMGRNKVIYALSRATLVVASDHETGGTWAGALESLRQSIAPVLVWTGEGAGPGNRVLVERGGQDVSDIQQVKGPFHSSCVGHQKPLETGLAIRKHSVRGRKMAKKMAHGRGGACL